MALACGLALGLACFGDVLFRGKQFGYRDAAHFYYPLYLRVQQEWEAGRIPLWSPEENAGMPLLGNPTAAVLYPGKLLHAALPYPWAVRVYTIAHVAIAVFGMFRLLRWWGTSRTGSTLSALAYGFGAPVLFQYCNIIFLVGAAWLPMGLQAIDRWVRVGQRRGLAELAVVLALQTLGGDPQSAYVLGLMGGGYAVGLAVAARWSRAHLARAPWLWAAAVVVAWFAIVIAFAAVAGSGRTVTTGVVKSPSLPPPASVTGISPKLWGRILLALWAAGAVVTLTRLRTPAGRRWRTRFLGLGLAGGVAILLTGAQLLPVIEFTGRTVRSAEDGSHGIFPFSVEPWRLFEMAWPELFGRSMTNRHWLASIPPGHTMKIWVPSLYLGGSSLILALGALGFRNGPPWRAWLTAIALGGLLLSLGEFASPVWAARNVPGLEAVLGPHDPRDYGELRRDGCLADGFGSPYWLLAWSFPGFRTFRYPSKFLTYSTLALAALAGLGWDAAVAGRRTRAIRWGGAIVGLGSLALVAWYLLRDQVTAWWIGRPPETFISAFGPFDAAGAWTDTARTLVQGSLVALLTLVLLRMASRRRVAAGIGLLVLLTADLILANAAIVGTVPQALLDQANRPEVLERIEAAERASGSSEPYRVHRMPLWEPLAWRQEVPEDRIRDLVQWERQTIQPKYAIPFGLCYTLTEGTAELYDYWYFFAPFLGIHGDDVARAYGLQPGEKLIYFPRRGYDLWNTKYFVLPSIPSNDERRGFAAFLPFTELIYPRDEDFEGPDGARRREDWNQHHDWQIRRNLSTYPRAWIVHQVRHLPPIRGLSRETRSDVMEEIVYQGDEFWYSPGRILWDPHEMAWVELESGRFLEPRMPGGPPDPDETVQVVENSPQRVVLEASLNRPGLVVLADVFYPGWSLTIDGQSAEIIRANRMMRGATVPSGTHRLVYTYRPLSFRLGAGLSGLGLLVLAGMCVWARRQGREESTGAAAVGSA